MYLKEYTILAKGLEIYLIFQNVSWSRNHIKSSFFSLITKIHRVILLLVMGKNSIVNMKRKITRCVEHVQIQIMTVKFQRHASVVTFKFSTVIKVNNIIVLCHQRVVAQSKKVLKAKFLFHKRNFNFRDQTAVHPCLARLDSPEPGK